MDRDVFAALTTGLNFSKRKATPAASSAKVPAQLQHAVEPGTNDPLEVCKTGLPPPSATWCWRSPCEGMVQRCRLGARYTACHNRPHCLLSKHCAFVQADNALRKQHRIKVAGGDVPPPLRSFEQLQSQPRCPPGLQAALASIGCQAPTPIQRQAIPVLLAGREVLAVAPTGEFRTKMPTEQCASASHQHLARRVRL